MALLTSAKRKEYFNYLGLGAYNKANILKFQKKYFTRAKDHDGLYGPNTDNLLRHVYNVKKYAGKNFKPEEFRCGCGRKYCTGYPTYMKPAELANLQTIRTHYGKPMQITSGLRCKGFNSRLKGSSTNSKHLTGQAADFYMAGVTDTLARRKSAIAYIKKLPNHNWTYGNGWCSKGYSVSAPNMGNAIHTDALNNEVKATTTTAAAKAPAAKAPAVTTQTKAQKINQLALEYAWPAGTPESKYRKKGGSPCPTFKTAWKKYYPKRKINTGCHSYVMLVLRAAGYSTMDISSWGKILKYLRKNFTEIKPNFKQSQLKPGDIRVHKNASGGHHIWIIVQKNGKYYRAEANQGTKNDRYAHLNASTSGNTKKHKADYLFRAK